MASTSFANDPTRITHVIVIAVFSFLATIAVVFRLWARKIKKTVLEANDYLIIPGLFWALVLSIFTMYSTASWELGEGAAQAGNADADEKYVALQGKAMLIGEISWAAAVFFDRTSILALYIRIFRTKSFRMTCWAVIGINTAFFIATVLGATLICRPIALIWDHSIHAGWCGDQKSLDIFIGVFNLVMDVTVILLPMPVLWGLQMAVGKKLVLSGIFAVGIVICITTLVRIQISGENHGSNSQQVYSLVALLTCLEALLGVINACLPVMKPVFQKLGESKASGWVSSVMSGSIPIFLKRSQMATSRIADSEEIATWHGQKTVKTPPSRFFERRPSNMGFPLPPTDMNAHPVGPVDSTPPPVPPKSPTSKYNKPSPTARWEVEKKLGIVVQTDWDVERQDRVQSDRTPLKDKRENYSQW